MKWQTIRRETGLIEHVCEHGVGHPNYGSALWLAGDDEEEMCMVHGCDGCCGRDDFPGTPKGSLKHAHKLIREYLEKITDLEAELLLAKKLDEDD